MSTASQQHRKRLMGRDWLKCKSFPIPWNEDWRYVITKAGLLHVVPLLNEMVIGVSYTFEVAEILDNPSLQYRVDLVAYETCWSYRKVPEKITAFADALWAVVGQATTGSPNATITGANT